MATSRLEGKRNAMAVAVRLLVAVAPCLMTLLFAWLVTGPLSLGGGEKDILLVIPLLFWSLLFCGSQLVLWWRSVGMGRSIAISAGVATVLVIVAMGVLAIVLQLRVAS